MFYSNMRRYLETSRRPDRQIRVQRFDVEGPTLGGIKHHTMIPVKGEAG